MSGSGGIFAPLTRTELDTLMATAEHAYAKSQAGLATCDLMPEIVFGQAAVAGDCLGMWQDALDESIWRLWHGEKLTA